MAKALELRVGAAGDALDRFEAAWNRAAEGRRMPPLAVLTLPDLPALLKNLSPARWQLLERLRAAAADAGEDVGMLQPQVVLRGRGRLNSTGVLVHRDGSATDRDFDAQVERTRSRQVGRKCAKP